MADKIFPQSGLPIRKTVELLPTVFRTDTNSKFMAAVVDPLSQPGVLQKTVGYVGRRYGKTYLGKDIYLDSDNTLRSRYQLEPSVVVKDANGKIEHFYDYIDFKNQLKFFGNSIERDDLITAQEHHSWNPPKQCDKFVNYREYYWVPEGPPSVVITGQKATVVSEYSVRLGLNSFIFTPDGYANNPTLVLYRGQTYKFKINAPREGFSIRTTYDTGSLIYNTKKSYVKGQLAIYDGKLWEAITAVNLLAGFNEQDWKYLEDVSSPTAFDYNNGITNNNVENGILTFTVPYDAPDTLYYQGLISPDRFGRFIVADIESNTKINVEKEIVGKSEYTSSNGVKFTSGLVVEFRGDVTPKKYATGIWVVESVGVAISLTNFQDLVVPELSSNETPEVLFDNEGFDTQPFDDATAYPAVQDYVVIARDSIDRNPWSRYNRWFHREVLEFAYNSRGQEFSEPETARAKRPIIEFLPNLQLFNHGSITKDTVDYIDDYTDDIFSKIEGSTGYNVDGDALFNGARILVVADTDRLANNKIYEVQFITHNNRKQIHLEPTVDSVSNLGDGVLIRRGAVNQGKMFHFNGTSWVPSQLKTRVNQPPRFDVFDEDGVSFGDSDRYPVSSFTGCNILSYRIGNGKPDPQMGFPLSYLNIDNIGDVQYNFEWDTDTFTYIEQAEAVSKKISTGYYKFNPDDIYGNCWTQTTLTFIQPIIDSVVVTEETDRIRFTTINWADVADSLDLVIKVYRNGLPFAGQWTRTDDIFVFDTVFAINDTVSIKVIADTEPNTGYYQLPVGLEKNPLNDPLEGWTLGQAVDHLVAALEFNSSFTGILPGLTNLRDIPINEFGQPYNTLGTRYLRHAGLAPMSIMLLCDKTTNVIKSLQYAKKSYTNFKNNFLEKAITIEYNDNIPNFVDDIINNLTKTKTTDNPFVDSDMIGSGAYTSINYVVEDVGIKTFSLSEKFSLTELSRRAVYVYIDNNQLLNGSDYEFNETFGFVKIKVDLAEGDEIEIREYISTATNYIPPTPSSMGLYKKYTPMKFVDDTYRIPKEVIQGHDGSITLAYGDFRDDLLLELEKRIYNNIKQEYDPAVFDIDTAVSGYYGNGTYTKAQLDSIVSKEFLKWAQGTTVNYTVNEYFVENESFTYTYSNMTDPTDTQNLPGYWRGVYQWFYDTDRPHRCPWEMLGFSEQPIWWKDEYGPAPYTSNNLILWEDLQNGVIRQGSRAGRYARYSRPSLLDHIPVDGDGVLLSPLDSGLANNFTLINNKGPFVLGDVGPVEYAWRSSSEWPFTVVLAMCLLKPFEFITDSFDRSRTKINILGQTVSAETDNFIRLEDIVIPETGGAMAVGLVKYLVDHAKSKGTPSEILQNKIRNLDVQLATRLSGFVDKTQQRYLLDSKSPASASSGIFVPPEDYEIIFNTSSPITTLTYSGVVLEKTEGGWIVTGYDDIDPYFSYLEAIPTQNDPVISVGGVSENFSDWLPETTYSNGQIVRYQSKFYRAIRTHNSVTSFDFSAWKQLAKVPLVGAVEAFKRKTFNTLFEKKLGYGTKLTTTQQVVDFLLGYEAFLISRGFVFDEYDSETQTSRDWTTSCKEFMFWTKHNWAIGSLITLSPSAEKIKIQIPVGVATDLLDGFYDYQVLKADGKPISPQFINVNRSYQSIDVETSNTTDGLFFLKLFYVLKENVTVFNDRTVFNDILYDKPTGYRQERIKSQGFRTVDWDGDYTSPGFLFDNVNIKVWQPFTDYKLGDIVSYRSYNWTSLVNQLGTEEFEPSNWTRLDSTPEKRLVANFDYRINQMEDYYDVASNGIGQTETALARHAVGYQPRNYLQNLAEDPVTQFQLYQGFIREKGTNNAITKVFDKLSRSGDSSIILNEEWAFRVGQFGGLDQLTEVEMMLYKDKFAINPQPVLLTRSVDTEQYDQNYRIAESEFTIKPTPFDLGINPTTIQTIPTRTAGYVNTDQVVTAVSTRDDILDLDISVIRENDHIWITFDSYTWTVLRYNVSPVLRIIDVEKTGSTVVIEFQRIHSIAVGDIVGIKNVKNLIGFFKVNDIEDTTISITVDATDTEPQIDDEVRSEIGLFTVARVESYTNLDTRIAALIPTGSKLWIDNNGNEQWEVVEKQKQYNIVSLTDIGVPDPQGLGKSLVYSKELRQTIAGMPHLTTVISYVDTTNEIKPKQIISPPIGFAENVTGSFGSVLAISPDNRFLIVGSPLANNITSFYRGEFDSTVEYLARDIVMYNDSLWESVINGQGAAEFNEEDWVLVESIPATQTGRYSGFEKQGMITIYEYRAQQWEIRESFISPRPETDELFGSAITIGQVNSTYYMAVSAVGSLSNRGRVYLYVYNGTAWKHLEDSNYLTELAKQDDRVGIALVMNRDASIIAVGAPYSDGEYFENYKGVWRIYDEYLPGDVVKHINTESRSYSYYRLVADSEPSIGNNPADGDVWESIIEFENTATGTVYIHQRTINNTYELKQTLNIQSLSSISDIFDETVSSGDQFGYAIDFDSTGDVLVISSPKADLTLENQGSVYIFRNESQLTISYRLKQKIESYELYTNEYFGHQVSISDSGEKIVVSGKTEYYTSRIRFDNGTTFEEDTTRFIDSCDPFINDDCAYEGTVYVFENKLGTYFLTEKLEAELSLYESFGYSLDCTDQITVVGSPNYIAPVIVDGELTYPGPQTGTIRLFRKSFNSSSWKVIARQEPTVDLTKIKSIAVYDNVRNIKLQDIDYVDHAKLKILNSAEQEIKFKTLYDPAVYTIGTDEQVVDSTQNWAEKHVGQIWWDLSTAKWLDYEQDDLAYRVGNWNRLAPGASIDVYEWVGTPLLPNEWAALADTTEGTAEGISGQPLYPNNDVFSVKVLFNPTTGVSTGTIYYYWVKNKRTIPTNMPARRISAASITTLIENPSRSGVAFLALIDADKFLAYNFDSLLISDTALLNIQYRKNDKELNPVHNEYQLLTDGVADSLPTKQLETKWIDSLVGQDEAGNIVPDIQLSAKQKYGVGFRPRQTMFVDRLLIVRTVIENINTVLRKQAFADIVDYKNLDLVDTAPAEVLNLYDLTVDSDRELETVGTVRVKQAVLRANIINGEIDTIDVIESGFGYRPKELYDPRISTEYKGPPVVITGGGVDAKAESIIDNQGRIIRVVITSRGKRYLTADATVRNFSVLVNADSTINNFWSIYAWDDVRKLFFKTKSQSYDTPRYWKFVDWWAEGFGATSRIIKELGFIADVTPISVQVGDLIRVKEFANGGWAVFEAIDIEQPLFTDNYRMVGRQNGTIEISRAFYENPIAYDSNKTFDTVAYDIENSRELRNILRAAKEDIFVGEYAVEWNKLFFTCIRYVFSEQIYVDWAFKTSFLNAIHNVGAFEQKLNYRNDNLVDFQSYIDEVKPYRTTVREYVSRYDTLENSRTAISDFDLPATYSVTEGKVIPIDIASSNLGIYPWKWWADNNTYSVVSIEIYNSGEGYINPPRVIIEGDGTGATAQAYISSGRVSGVRILTEGTGYTKAPTVSLVGGNGSNPNIAKASVIIGNSNVRTINMTLKFDRVAKTRNYQTYTNREIFTAAGFISVFDLKFAPIEDKSKITVYKNDQLVTQSEFNIRLYRTMEPGYSLLRGQLRFVQPPLSGDIIEVTYEKNDELLSSIDRIEKYYSPTSGMKGKELNQLMTGIDFGGVMIQGTTFDVTGGWDALPWFTDNWDSVESSADFYYRFDAPQYEEEKLYRVNDRVSYEGRVYVAQIGSVGILPDITSETWIIETPDEIILPFTPAVGQAITIYLKLAGDNQPTIRIDDPFFDLVDDSTITVNPNVKMPTFIGDGSTTVVEIGQYISINAGDTLIFRPIDSDGSVTIKDPNLLDTQLSGGTLISDTNGAYSTASGIAADDISLDGDKFISPEQVPAPEENIPGQVLDSVAIRVYNSTVEGAVPLQSRTLIADGTTRVYDIGLEVLETNSILVYVDKIKKEIDSEYTVNFINNTVDFITPLLANSVLEIIAIGIAGISLIDYQEFVADGSTGLFLTNANFADTANVFVTVNGQYQEIGFINSTDIIDTPNKALVQFGIRPPARAVVKIVAIGKNSKINIEQLPVVRVNKQKFEYDGSTRSFELTDYVDQGRGSLLSSMIVEVDEVILKGVDTVYARYDGIKNDFVLGIDPAEGAGSIITNNIQVFVNEELKTFIRDYTYNAIDKVLIINRTVLSVGDIIKIENSLRTEYSVKGNILTINDGLLSDNSNIEVTWFSQYPSMALVSDEYTGGKVRYILSQKPLGASYIWVYKTTQDTLGNISTTRLTKDIDYSVSLPRGALYLRQETTANDTIKVVMFGSSIYRLPSAFEIHKDMLNVYRFNRYKLDKDVKLSKDLNYYDDVVLVTNANNLFDPVKEKNAPGTVHINGERIDYMIRSPSYNQSKVYKPGDYATYDGKIWRATALVDNTLTDAVDLLAAGWVVVKTVPAEATHVLTELRRGVHGSAIAEIHKSGSYVVDVSLAENLPYTETQNRFDFVSNGTPDDSTAGTAQTMGPLEFIPLKSLKNNWYRETIPEDFGPCDTVEVFVGGRRLRKDPILVYDETEGSSSPLADKMLEAEFSVDGTTNTIRLTTPAPLGTRVTVIRKVGTVWNNAATGSSRVSLLDSGTIIADFIAKQTTELPE